MTIVENLPEGQYSHMPELIDVIHNNNMARYGFEALDDTGSPISDEQYMEMVKRGIRHTQGETYFRLYSRVVSAVDFGEMILMYTGPCGV